MKERYWKYSLIVFIIGLGYLLFRQAQPFMNGILGGFTLYLLLRNFTFWLQTKMKPAMAGDNWSDTFYSDTTFSV
mgnify:CR=1 FL=1